MKGQERTEREKGGKRKEIRYDKLKSLHLLFSFFFS
jgi:hypothetical protein